MSDGEPHILPTDVCAYYDGKFAHIVEWLESEDIIDSDEIVRGMELHIKAEECIEITNIETMRVDHA